MLQTVEGGPQSLIEVGEGSLFDKSNMFMSWTDTNNRVQIGAMGISSYGVYTGRWKFDVNDGGSIN